MKQLIMKETLNKWQKDIDNLLSYPQNESQVASQIKPQFEHEENFEHLQIPNFDDLEEINDKIILLFSRLSSCYEYGLLFEKKENNLFSIQLGFDHGNIFSFENSQLIHLPKTQFHEIYRLKTLDWFAKYDIGGLSKLEDYTHLLFQPWDRASMLFSTKLADPWLKIQAEKTLEYLIKHNL